MTITTKALKSMVWLSIIAIIGVFAIWVIVIFLRKLSMPN